MVIERAHRIMDESRNLLDQRESQLRQMEQFLQQSPRIARKFRKAGDSCGQADPKITKHE